MTGYHDNVQKALQTRQPEHLRPLLRVCEERAELFETSIPWPALAASWRADAEALREQLKG